ncbi:MAG: PEP-CTERM sorting domain-containing protein [Phycisphaerae bacterium]
MKRVSLLLAALVWAVASSAQAALLLGPPTITVPTSLGTPTPAALYTYGTSASGLWLSGDFYETFGAVSVAGTLLHWEVSAPINSLTTPSFLLTTNYTGFISLTGGASSMGGGVLLSEIMRSGSAIAQSHVQFSHTGPLTVFPAGTSDTALVTGYVWAAGDSLRMTYDVLTSYAGTGGTYDLNFPAETSLVELPEPASALLLLAGLGAVSLRRRRSR